MNGERQNKNPADDRVIIGVDVGTGSARAGVFDQSGTLLATAKRDITLFRGAGHAVEQSSREIWDAVCSAVREAVDGSGVAAERVAGIGFDATCSLVVIDAEGNPLAVGETEDPDRNIIVWMDHRATDQAERINALNHPVLKYVGGKISPEMETPKILWLKENRREIYDKAWQFFDLADFLTWHCTGDLARSTCTVTCKWTYLAHEKRWDDDYFRQIGLSEIVEEQFLRIGQHIVEPGTRCGEGLTQEAANQLGLPVGTAVAAGMIDAHAGGIGTAGIKGKATNNLAYVFGTSSCTMTTTEQPVFIPGVWGPYFSAMVPGMWLNEGGQSAAGAAIDQLLSFHPAAREAEILAEQRSLPLPVLLANLVLEKVTSASAAVELTHGLHVVPEFLGNRAPFADPHARAVIAGLGMEKNLDSLLSLYIAGICSIGYGLRQIIDAQARAGAAIENIVVSGGAGQHPLIRQLLADTTGRPVISTKAPEPVLLGSAILAAFAGKLISSVSEGMERYTAIENEYWPELQYSDRHLRRYITFERLQENARHLDG
ncbi:FGGY-family carbohydrate kinase [Yersinia kristensenii]|uniref:FGGY-family carbohydrate kinase n=1 Tax=Yersinia kristensenii TaxID=28152 RepID=UPI0011A25664|nr:FGGY-family carbohydrate kinase [Yersinia kristensenii]